MPANIILQGTTIEKNQIPPIPGKPIIKIEGEFRGQKSFFGLDEDVLSKHTLFVGGTGCGKSNLFYHFVKQIKANMGQEDVMIIFDSKGDFYERFPPVVGDVVIGNSTTYREFPQRWNIFKEVVADGWEDGQVTINAQEICKAFFEERVAKNNNPFFPNAARDVLASIVIALINESRIDKEFAKDFLYNNELKKLINSFSPAQLVHMTAGLYPEMNKVKTYIGTKGSKQAEGVLAEMYSVVDDIFRGVFAEKGTFSIRNFVRKKGKKTLYIEYDLSSGSVLGPIYTLLFDLALKEALGRTEGSKGNVYLIVDELKLLPRLQHMDDGINFGRSLGVKILAGLQSIEQLNADYDEADAKNIISGFSSIYAFRANDPRTREYIRDLFGGNLVIERYQGTDRMLNDAPPRNGYTVEDWELRNLKTGEAIIGLPNAEPFKFHFQLYRR